MEINRVYVFEGYFPRGGTYMAYHLGRICFQYFGKQVYMVGSSKKEGNYFTYDYNFPTISQADFLTEVKPNDLLICNPSFSHNLFGLKLDCKKLMYVQGTSTFEVLDIFFDYYISASTFVQDYLENYYKIKSHVINPFINLTTFNQGLPWNQRSDQILVLDFKQQTVPLLNKLLKDLSEIYPNSKKDFKMIKGLSQEELAINFGKHKFYLNLSPIEGFGLPGLEAMASGCCVLGLDSMGGLDYFKNNENAMVVPYSEFHRLVHIIESIGGREDQRMAEHAIESSKSFSREVFDKNWSDYLASILNTESQGMSSVTNLY